MQRTGYYKKIKPVKLEAFINIDLALNEILINKGYEARGFFTINTRKKFIPAEEVKEVFKKNDKKFIIAKCDFNNNIFNITLAEVK